MGIGKIFMKQVHT